MKLLKDKIRERVAQKHLGKDMIGSIALNEVRRFFGLPANDEFNKIPGEFLDNEYEKSTLDWYVKFNKMFVKTSDQAIKIKIFKQKNEILDKVNNVLVNVWYKVKVVDIYLK